MGGIGVFGRIRGWHLNNQDGLLQSTLENSRWYIEHCRHSIGGDGVRGYLTKHQPDPQAVDMSCWPAVVPLLTTRCLYWGWGVKGANKGHMGHRDLHMTNEDGLLQRTLENSSWSIAGGNRTWPQVNGTHICTTLGHEMHYHGGTSDQRSAWPKGWPNVKLTWCCTVLGH